jgi:chloramphenicol-sensitive protein RarD
MPNTDQGNPEYRFGISLAVFAYLWWGFAPIYWHLIDHVNAIHAVINRMAWSGPTLLIVVLISGQWKTIWHATTKPKTLALLFFSGIAVTINWGVYVWGVMHDSIKEVSLGYYLLPLFNVLMGFAIFKERPNRTQWLAIFIASAGIILMLIKQGSIPWLAIAIATSFCLYGALRKITPVTAMAGNTMESLLLVPIALGWMLINQSTASLGHFDTQTDALLILSGAFTVIPLLSYIAAAQRVTLTSMSLVFYLGPSLQMLLAIFLYGETVTFDEWVAFACIAAALVIHTTDLLRKLRNN